jgi:hypothetical protein
MESDDPRPAGTLRTDVLGDNALFAETVDDVLEVVLFQRREKWDTHLRANKWVTE